MSAADLIGYDSKGVYVPTYSELLQGLTDDLRGVHGSDLVLSADSVDGVTIGIFALVSQAASQAIKGVYDSLSPQTAAGIFLEQAVKLNGIAKQQATNSQVSLTLTGTAGTVITNGVVKDSLGQLWDLPASVTLPASPTATARESGAVQAQAGTVTIIETPFAGWQTVTNATAASPGNDVETDAELRKRQKSSTALPSSTTTDKIKGAIELLDGVDKVAPIIDNDTDSTDANGVPARSIAVTVQGGDNDEIAEQIALGKTAGCGTHGNTTVSYTYQYGITKDIEFSRPSLIAPAIVVTKTNKANWVTSDEDEIKQSIVNYVNGLDIGQDVEYGALWGPAYLNGLADSYELDGITINGDTANVVIAFNELAQITTSNVTVNDSP